MQRSAIFSVSTVVSSLLIGLISGSNSFINTNFAAQQSMLTSPDLIKSELHLVSQTNSSTSSILTNDTNGTKSADKLADVFGITEIYPTKDGGREWFINISNPVNSSNFSITDGANLTKLPDNAWRINSSHVRMVVNTSGAQEKWRDVEITGYIRLSHPESNQTGIASNNTASPDEEEADDLVFISRSGRHSSAVPCEGTAYNGGFHTDGSIGWKKEIWHTGGYTDERSAMKVADSFLNKWIGWKVVVYNISIDNNRSAVKLESYIDESNSNNWTKLSDFIDSGGWYTKSSNTEFFSAGCGKARDQVILEGGPNVIFRTDNIILDFRDLSVREISPFKSNLTSVLDLEAL